MKPETQGNKVNKSLLSESSSYSDPVCPANSSKEKAFKTELCSPEMRINFCRTQITDIHLPITLSFKLMSAQILLVLFGI